MYIIVLRLEIYNFCQDLQNFKSTSADFSLIDASMRISLKIKKAKHKLHQCKPKRNDLVFF